MEKGREMEERLVRRGKKEGRRGEGKEGINLGEERARIITICKYLIHYFFIFKHAL